MPCLPRSMGRQPGRDGVWLTCCLFFLSLVFFLSPPLSADNRPGFPKAERYAAGELLVQYNPSGLSTASRYRFVSSQWKNRTIRTFPAVGVHQVAIREGLSVEEALTICRNDPGVAFAEPNYIRRSSLMPNDARFDALWGLDNTGQTGGLLNADIDAVEAWDSQTGNGQVIVAVIDSGTDLDHEDLLENIWQNTGEDWIAGDPGYNGIDDDGNGKVDDYYGWDFIHDDGFPDDDNGHGTHVSGTVGARGDNGMGVVGVAWSVSIMPLKILDDGGSGTVADELEAIAYALENGANVINASYSGSNYSSLEYQAIEMAADAGLLFVAAAGNNGWNNDEAGNQAYPAGYDLENIIAVAATNHLDYLAGFSSYGTLSVDVTAPGVNILSTIRENQYDYKNGTSMATPHVSGLAALIWAEDMTRNGHLTMTATQVRERIFFGVDVLSGLSGKVRMAGRINANKSLLPTDFEEIPVRPSNLAAEALSSKEVQLTWIDPSLRESGFKVFCSTASDGLFTHVGTAGENAETFTDTTARDGSTNFYTVRAFNRHGESEDTLVATAVTPLAPPSGLTAVPVADGHIKLFWTDNSEVETGYVVEEQVGADSNFLPLDNLEANVQFYSRTGLDPSLRYAYRVKAVDGNVDSEYSNLAGTVAAAPSGSDGGGDTSGSSGGGLSSSGGGGGGGCFIDTILSGKLF